MVRGALNDENRAGTGHGSAAVGPELAQRFEAVREIFSQIIDAPTEEQEAALDRLTSGDPLLRELVSQLLTDAELAHAEGFLSTASGTGSGESSRTLPNAEPMPERIGRYQIVGVLGEGGTGIVYRGQSPPPVERDVAIKVMRAGSSERAAQRFKLEVVAMASMQHPSVVQVFECGQLSDGRWWAAYALVEGEPIASMIGERVLSWQDRVDIVRQAAEGVHHAHQRGVIHRDLKPSNIMVSFDDAGLLRATVIDFGVARLVRPNAPVSGMTEAGMIVGTLGYMSPEQIESRDVDARTDVYALGLILADLLSGKHARGKTSLSTLAQAAQQSVSVRLSGCGGCERDLNAVIMRATEPDPNRRYASAQHFADDLERVLSGRPVMAVRASTMYRAWLLCRRHPLGTLIVMMCLFAMMIMGTGLAISRERLALQVQDQRELITSLIEDSLNRLSVLSGTAESRWAMVDLLMNRVERQLTTYPQDYKLRAAMARLLRERGDLYYIEGDLESARDDFVRSAAVYQGLHRERPLDIETGRLYAESVVRVGDMVRGLVWDGTGQFEFYEQAMSIQLWLLELDPEHLGLRDDLSWSYDRLRTRYDPIEHRGEMEAWLNQRLRLATQLYLDTPERALSKFNLSSSHFRLASLHERAGEPLLAARHLWSALHLAEQIVTEQPERMAFIEHYVLVLRAHVRNDIALGRQDRLQTWMDQAISIARQYSHSQPSNAFAEGLLALTLTAGADLALRLGELDNAQSLLDETKGILDSIEGRGLKITENASSARHYYRTLTARLAKMH